jgi:hypothetical protein
MKLATVAAGFDCNLHVRGTQKKLAACCFEIAIAIWAQAI